MSKEEFYAATVEEAVERAASALNVARDQLVYQILDSGGSGFLGIGARDARIEVQSTAERSGNVDEAASAGIPHSSISSSNEGEVESPEPVGSTAVPVEGDEEAEEVPEELLEDIKSFVDTVARDMGLDARVDAYDAGEVIAVDVALEETGLFIGQKGETIDAIQYLTNVSAYKDRDFVKKIVLDSQGYRQRRVEALEGMAHRAARRAARDGRAIELAPMSSSERRVIHLYLKENAGVSTRSEGNGEHRKVIVSPQ